MKTWVPVDNSGDGVLFSNVVARYIEIDEEIQFQLNLTFQPTSGTNVAKVSLPTSSILNEMTALSVGYNSSSQGIYAQVLNGNVKFYTSPSSITALTNAQMSGVSVNIAGFYFKGD